MAPVILSQHGPVATMSSTSTAETARGQHTFTVAGYSLHKGLGAGRFLRSATFHVGGHGWRLRYYPDGHADDVASKDFVCVYLELMAAAEVRAVYDLRLLDQLTGEPKVLFRPAAPRAFSAAGPAWGARRFIRRAALEASTFLRDDRIVIECRLAVVITKPVAEPGEEIQVPPSDLALHLGRLLAVEEGADVAFKVQEEVVRAHRAVLAARSPVFRAELCGPMRDTHSCITPVEDMHPAVFRALLHFVYTDSLPAMDDLDGASRKEIVKHLLVAADRYAMERMKLECASILRKRLAVESVPSTLALADRYNCSSLRDACIEFIVSSNSMDEVMRSQGYEELKRACPAVTVEVWERVSKARRIDQCAKQQPGRVLDGLD